MNKILVVGAPSWGVAFPYYSIAVVAELARNAGWEADIRDLNVEFYNHISTEEKKYWEFLHLGAWRSDEFAFDFFDRYEEFFSDIIETLVTENDYSLIAFSVNDWTRAFSLKISQMIKSFAPQQTVLFGGVSCYPREHGTKLLKEPIGAPDVILTGEAEIEFPKYLEIYGETGDFRCEVPGFAYRAPDGAIIENGIPALPKLRDVDIITTFDGFDLTQYSSPGDFPSHISRGCIYKCRFCSEFVNKRLYRARPGEQIYAEVSQNARALSHLKEVPHVYFVDSLMNGKIREMELYCDLLIENNVKVTWGGQIHFREEMTRELLEKMQASGCREFLWGFESGSQRVIDLMLKRYDLDNARRILRDCSDLEMISNLPVMIGFPGELPDDIVQTILFVFENRKFANFFLPGTMEVLSNSPIGSDPANYGLDDVSPHEWTTADGTNTPEIRAFRRFFVANAVNCTRFLMFDVFLSLDFTQRVMLNEAYMFLSAVQGRFETLFAEQSNIFQMRLQLQEILEESDAQEMPDRFNTDSFKLQYAENVLELLYKIEGENVSSDLSEQVQIVRADQRALGWIDEINGTKMGLDDSAVTVDGREVVITGWAGVPGENLPGDAVFVSVGDNIFKARYGFPRGDVKQLVDEKLYFSGFRTVVPAEFLKDREESITIEVRSGTTGSSFVLPNSGLDVRLQ